MMTFRFRNLLFLILATALFAAAVAKADPDASAAHATPAASAVDTAAPPGQAPPAAANATALGTVTPAQAQRVLETIQDDSKRNQLVETLRTIAKTAPGKTPDSTATVVRQTAPAPSPPKPAAKTTAAARLDPNSLGADLLGAASDIFGDLGTEAKKTASALGHISDVWTWLIGNFRDPGSRARLITGSEKLILTIGAALAMEWAAIYLIRRPLLALRKPVKSAPAPDDRNGKIGDTADDLDEPSPDTSGETHGAAWRHLRRVPFMLAALFLDLLPVLAFVILAYLIAGIDIFGESPSADAAILIMVNAYVITRFLLCVVRAILSPESGRLRLLTLTDHTASYLQCWVRRIAVVAIFGGAIAEIATLYDLEDSAHDALLKLVALVVHIFLAIIVLQSRRKVAGLIAGPEGRRTAVSVFRHRLAAIWHYIALFYIVALWVVWAIEVKHGVSQLFRLFFSTVGILFAARIVSILALGLLDRSLRGGASIVGSLPSFDKRAERYHALLKDTIWAVIAAVTAVTLLQIWGFNALGFFSHNQIGGRLLSALVTIAIATATAIVVWEVTTGTLERHVGRLADDGQYVRAARLRTLTPMLRTALGIALLIILGMTALSEIGINIAPLLAGAGILGVAVGFGSQKLVQDLITGIFLLLENAMQVGDWVNVAGLSGSVEHLSIRTIRLRAGDGSVHIIPFSAVTTVTNTNRGVGNAAVRVTVSYDEDTDQVGEILKQIALDMRSEEKYCEMMTSDLQLWGVDSVEASAVTMAGQIACSDSGRWGVQREFNRRMKLKFQELGIRIASPAQTVLVRQDEHRRVSKPLPARVGCGWQRHDADRVAAACRPLKQGIIAAMWYPEIAAHI